jgi:hypothetical protein
MHSLIITHWRVEIEEVEGRKYWVRQLNLEKDGVYRFLHDGKSFDPMASIEIWLMVLTWPKAISKRLPLPPALTQVVASFLSTYHGKEHDLDCYDFANLVAGIPLHNKAGLYGFWKERRRLLRQPGDVVFLFNKKRMQFRHAAIYLGHGLYISVYGKSGNIEVTTLRDMRKAHGAKNILDVVPKKN